MDILKKHGFKLFAGSYLGFLTFGVITLIVSLIFFGIMGTSLYQAFDLNQLDLSNPNPDIATLYQLIEPLGYAFIITLVFMFLIYFISTALFTAGMTSAVNEAVYQDQSSTTSFLTYGFKRFWKMLKLLLAYFVVLYIPLMLVDSLISVISSHSPALGLLLLIPYYILTILLHVSMVHGIILYLQKDLRVWTAVKAGFQTLTRAFGQTFLSGILLLVLSIAVMIVFGILVVLSLFIMGTASEPNPFFFLLMILVIGVIAIIVIPPISIIYQLIITKRLKEIIEPRVFGNHSETQQQASNVDSDLNSNQSDKE
ncbi:hypothetical protein J2Z48_001296 [Croceifilum oryzae]|uniref:Uncharacterized protein n=1 Tax=Croceifilum oryzae TaxID=1553429 RepID=A0AAJ1TJG0_9BACL|nr:hypothetical protein [Croceifilum oryzae]MDQ0417124.1 hypothetical protein [Croceifilum oryzae]